MKIKEIMIYIECQILSVVCSGQDSGSMTRILPHLSVIAGSSINLILLHGKSSMYMQVRGLRGIVRV